MTKGPDNVTSAWRRIEEILQAYRPKVLASLRGPTSDSAFLTAEGNLGQTLPDDFRRSYSRHDGQETGESLREEWQLLSLDAICTAWRGQRELSEGGDFRDRPVTVAQGIRQTWWDIAWIPVLSNGAGDFLVIDLNPVSGGTLGQVIVVSHESGRRDVVASSLGTWLEQTADFWSRIASAESVRGLESTSGTTVGPSMMRLLSIVGKPLGDEQVKAFLASQPLERTDYEDGRIYLSCTPLGYGISCSAGLINTIEVRLSERLQGGMFRGDLVAGVRATDSHLEVEQKLGTPVASAGFRGVGPWQTGWIRYDMSQIPVTFAYRAEHHSITLIRLGKL